MPSIHKNRTPWFLVVTSMILLFLFVGYWNASTYIKEKKQLVEDVEIQLQLAYTEVKDSELIFFIKTQLSNDENNGEGFLPDSISIFLDDISTFPSNGRNILNRETLKHHKTCSDTTVLLDVASTENQNFPIKDNSRGREIKVIASSNVNSIVINGIASDPKDTSKLDFRVQQVNIHGNDHDTTLNNFQLHSDRNFISSWLQFNDSFPTRLSKLTNDSIHLGSKSMRFYDPFLGETNTSVDKTYALFKAKLISNDLPSLFTVIKDHSIKEDGLRVTHKTNGLAFTDWTIDLKKYQLFIFKKMIPIFLFSLFLLGIISWAFWTLLTNWIKQNRLVVVKNEFINNMTHELKTPIATVGVALEAISNFDLNTEQDKTREYIDISRTEINRLSLLVDKVLNIAAFDSKDSVLKSQPVDLRTAVQNTIDAMKLQLARKNATVEFHNRVSNSMINGDELHIANVVHNIIDNALKYCITDPIVNITLNENQNNLILIFKDNGQGIPKEYQDKVFDRFFRVPTEDLHDVKGHGLGLNYVQNVIKGHRGKISLDSIEYQGSTFTITLPKSSSDA